MRRTIRWQYWRHPLGGGDEYMDYAKKRPSRRDRTFYEDDDQDISRMPVRPVVVTSGGVIPVSIYGDMRKQFNNWIGHTNFTVTNGMLQEIQTIDGVETLDPLTRYRFRVGFGLAFDDRSSRRTIERTLGVTRDRKGESNPDGLILNQKTEEQVREAKRTAQRAGRFWALYLMQTGVIDTTTTNDETSFKEACDLYKRCQKAAGGILYTGSADGTSLP